MNSLLKKIDSRTDVAYSVSVSSGGGLVKSRDFVNLRCWRLCNEGEIVENYDINVEIPDISSEIVEGGPSTSSFIGGSNESLKVLSERLLKKSASDNRLFDMDINSDSIAIVTNKIQDGKLSKSLGQHPNYYSDDEELFTDAQTDVSKQYKAGKNVFVSAAVSVDYPNAPLISKYIRFV